MNDDTTPLKARMHDLPVETQEALARHALAEMKNHSRLDRLAKGSVWFNLVLILPLMISVGSIGLGPRLAASWPFFVVFLLALLTGLAAYTHLRIDAIYQLMKLAQRETPACDTPIRDQISEKKGRDHAED